MTRDLVEVVHVAAGLVAAAMGLLIVSGLAFFLVGSEPTPKFWAKMVIVGIACLNGLAAHRLVFPLIEKGVASGTGRLELRPWSARFASASAAISSVSWSGALILGAWHGLKLGIVPILSVYAVVLAGAIVMSTILAPRIFVFTPADARRRSLRDLRLIPLAAAYAVALAIAEAALTIAIRMRSRAGTMEAAVADGYSAPADATSSAWFPFDTQQDWSHGNSDPTDSRLSQESLENRTRRHRKGRGTTSLTWSGPTTYGDHTSPALRWL